MIIHGFNTTAYTQATLEDGLFSPLWVNLGQDIHTDIFCATILHNTLTALGYIPGVGIAVGLYRIWVVCTHPSSQTERVSMVARAVFEIVGLGVVYLIVDLPLYGKRC